jgi:hypothetical protein
MPLFYWTLDIAAVNGYAIHQHEWKAANPGKKVPRRDRFHWQMALVDQLLGIENLTLQTKRGREALKNVGQVVQDQVTGNDVANWHFLCNTSSGRCEYCQTVLQDYNQKTSTGCSHKKCQVIRKGGAAPVRLHLECMQPYHERRFGRGDESTHPRTKARPSTSKRPK